LPSLRSPHSAGDEARWLFPHSDAETPALLDRDEELRWCQLARDRRWQRRWAAAESPCAAALRELARDRDTMIRTIVAENPDAPPALLAQLARDRSWMVRRAAAGNPQTPGAVLARLGVDRQREVRLAVAERDDPSMEALFTRLARDAAPTVRAAVAGSRWCPDEARRQLAQDRAPTVRYTARRFLPSTTRRPLTLPPSLAAGRLWLTLWPILGLLAFFLLRR
jgi:hypothetical protein